ncbi:GPI ethanolamine phosphate transferase 3 isoform X2 [Punica granatum]|uniref:GPI ethanolamine phosphate transferase 3 isoform X2 n=2 Tax=Punica granatum TaxID=22663 RepID=A0A6P8CEE4_PUNGR|nr:GPI ethanolamine phosphate transferase 3 isoform X2 [Punica granatum]
MKKWRTLCFFWAIMALHAVAILIFTRGFLLTRTELPFHSNCSDVSKESPCFSNSPQGSDVNSTEGRCWTKPAIGRLVIIVLDAIRFDFVAPSSFFKEKKPWMDRLPVLQKLAFGEGSSARIFKAIADPPTTSLQRLKGLTTGGLPTFIDVGNSFGAPAIVEDNLIHQLVENGKRVVMMGDDTWVQLFPHHFRKSYPFPSFNVKDLHTVDNGCIDNLLPTLYEEDWDVLIAHFLGVDHAGHIFGVDSAPMIEKLEQYNGVLEKVIDALESQSRPGGLHENTYLLVMGDHGQTLNGDHGGGSPEEVETSTFAMSFRRPPSPIVPELDIPCEFDLERRSCISNFQQLDFAATVSALMGIPFPFGSIGHVNPEMYALAVNTGNSEDNSMGLDQYELASKEWLLNYANVLCVNTWQVKRYIDIYSASSMIGFSSEDISRIADMYTKAEKTYRQIKDNASHRSKSNDLSPSSLKHQIDAYVKFLNSVAELARSKWTEFNLPMMLVGIGMMLMSLFTHVFVIYRLSKACGVPFNPCGNSKISLGLVFASIIVMIRMWSLFSNSYILEEGKVANFLLATSGLVMLRYSIMRRKMLLEAGLFLILVAIIRFTIEIGLSKQAATSAFLHFNPSWMLGIDTSHHVWTHIFELLPMLALLLLVHLLYKAITGSSFGAISKITLLGTIFSYILIAMQWASENKMLGLASYGVGRNTLPRIIYAIGFGQILLLILSKLSCQEKAVVDCRRSIISDSLAMLSAWSSTVIIISGQQGPLVALATLIGGYCIVRFHDLEGNASGTPLVLAVNPLSLTQWCLFAVCLFFCTGHWCAFDGLRYGAAFIGFDEFVLVRQAILLTIDTFGFSHIIPIFGLPFLLLTAGDEKKGFPFARLSLVYMIYGFITAATVTATLLCVMVHRRHLMVWGLFAPKFVFDVVGLMLTDVLICVASLYFLGRTRDNTPAHDHAIGN